MDRRRCSFNARLTSPGVSAAVGGLLLLALSYALLVPRAAVPAGVSSSRLILPECEDEADPSSNPSPMEGQEEFLNLAGSDSQRGLRQRTCDKPSAILTGCFETHAPGPRHPHAARRVGHFLVEGSGLRLWIRSLTC